ncbi:Crp/Fnr family transcriptional regulator [Emticicia sp. 17c]|uniref:Crp/Fnr family transcriptional regulator n=1 Tax=Emticicia sp. 17c TaxID=3127704 RepID=UPI00301D9E83
MSDSLITHIKKYVPLNEQEISIIKECVQELAVKKKEYLLKEGQICKANYFVEKGCLRMFFVGNKGEEQITQFALENWWISDYNSLMSQSPSGFYIQTIEPCSIIALTHQQHEKLASYVPAVEQYFRIIYQRAYSAAQQRIKYLYDFSREEMYRHFQQHYPTFVNRIPQYMIASFLGFTPEYLSEIRKKKQ